MKTKQNVMCIVLFIMVASNQLLPEVTKNGISLYIINKLLTKGYRWLQNKIFRAEITKDAL